MQSSDLHGAELVMSKSFYRIQLQQSLVICNLQSLIPDFKV